MHECEVCGGMYPSALAAALCGEDDREADLHARQMVRGRHRATHSGSIQE